MLWECCAAAGTGRLVGVEGKGEVTGMPICAQTSLMMLRSDLDSSANRTTALSNSYNFAVTIYVISFGIRL